MSEPIPHDEILAIGPRIRVLPVIHGSGDFAIRARDELLSHPYDVLAVPLPPSFQSDVELAIERLPAISAVIQVDAPGEDESSDDSSGASYVPIDPCQPVIAAIRTALGERIPRAYIDRETPRFEGRVANYPDPYAVKIARPESFAAAILPALSPPRSGQHEARIQHMAGRLRQLSRRHRSILFVCAVSDWPWIRDVYFHDGPQPPGPEEYVPEAPVTYPVDSRTLAFFLGELPFLTALYERGRRELTPDDNLSVDGVKEMVLEARDRLRVKHPKIARRITPQLLSVFFKYARNLSLMGRRLTPDLYTLVTVARQTGGDEFALVLAETARSYPHAGEIPPPGDPLWHPDIDEPLRMGNGRAEVPGLGVVTMVSRLPGQSISWKTVELRPRPSETEKRRWTQRWNPFGVCSWPPEDDRIESFQRHVREQAKAILGADLARVEKFTSSVRDGLDLRETLRNWHTDELYVKVIPPSRGSIEVVVFLFDSPSDPERYPHRATWYAEHAEESTLAFFSTDPMKDLVGPGIARAEYGGAFFLFPPRPIPDIWEDRRLSHATTLEERLLAGAFLHSRERHVAVVSEGPPLASWRRLARRHGRKLVHLPLRRFGGQTIERMRTFHVLNGRQVRSYASEFLRDS